MGSRTRSPSLIAATFLMLIPASALAHQINIYATVEGNTIRGKVYFRGNSPAQNVTVRASDSEGNELGTATTDEQGKFTLPGGGRVEHRLVADTGDGHVTAPCVLPAERFQDAPAADGQANDASTPAGRSPTPSAIVGRSSTPFIPVGRSTTPSIGDNPQVKQLHEQIDALQEELADCKSRLRVRDLLGGIGWIVGLAGIAYYYLGVRRKRMQKRDLGI
jgi:nickel transport protein